ncbi:MAG: winged helix-turn-helix domain-containing protein [Nanoarchaeota archaeon]|nr:winged helix-turn-helix domain-containing protein [Nanoarchaeota archaeon]
MVKKTSKVKLEPRFKAKKEQGKLSETELYELISKTPGLSTYDLQKKTKWSGGKVRATINRLEKMGIIETKKTVEGNRIKKICGLVNWKKLVRENNLIPKKIITIHIDADKITAKDILSNRQLFSDDVVKKISDFA